MSMDFEKEIAGIVALVPPEVELAPETVPIALESLEAIDRKYGPDSPRPLSFHNAPHSVGVTRRSVRLGKILLPYIQPRYRDRFFDLAIVDSTTHDYDQDSGPGENERNSADYAVAKVEEADGVLNTAWFKGRVPLGIDATMVEMRDGGELVQASLQKEQC